MFILYSSEVLKFTNKNCIKYDANVSYKQMILIHLVPLSRSHSYTFLYIDNFYVYLHIDFLKLFLYSIQMNCWTYTMYRERRSLFKGIVSQVGHKYN